MASTTFTGATLYSSCPPPSTQRLPLATPHVRRQLFRWGRRVHVLIGRLRREHLIPKRWKDTIPPVLLNTWEAMYFDVSHEEVLNLARAASRAGVEMIVLDDGWFGAREDATSSLGDWYEDRRKFPEVRWSLGRACDWVGAALGREPLQAELYAWRRF